MITITVTDDMRKSVWGPLDEMGLLLDLQRLPGEDNPDYRHRLFRVFTRPTDSTYQGLLNAITYELGLDFYDLISIEFVGDPTDVGLTADEVAQPRITIKDGVLTLYGHYVSDDENLIIQIDNKPQINLRKYEYADPTDLLDAINATGIFLATDLAIEGIGAEPRQDWSYTISNVDTNVWIVDEIVPASTRFTLLNSPLNDGMFFFGESRIFQRLRDSEEDILKPGDFYVDVETGEVVTASLPSGTGRVRYQYRNIPAVLEASPVSIGYIGSTEMQRYFFTQLELSLFDNPLERFINNIPTLEGTEIINELYRASNNYWGI